MTHCLFIYLSRSKHRPRNHVVKASSVWEAWRRFRRSHTNVMNVLNIRVT